MVANGTEFIPKTSSKLLLEHSKNTYKNEYRRIFYSVFSKLENPIRHSKVFF